MHCYSQLTAQTLFLWKCATGLVSVLTTKAHIELERDPNSSKYLDIYNGSLIKSRESWKM